MKNCVNITWRNGFGNMLFQYVYARLLSEEKGMELTYDRVGRACAASLIQYGFIKEPDDIVKYDSLLHKMESHIHYSREQAIELENPHHYKPYLDKIRNFFTKVEKTNYNDLVVHMRLGEIGWHSETPFEWYKLAIEQNNIEFDKMYICSDEPRHDWVNEFKKYYNAEVVSTENILKWEDRNNNLKITIDEFNFMRSFDKILFSNSTFSWWASLLSQASEIYFNSEWQPYHAGGKMRLGETDYDNWVGISPLSLKEYHRR